MRTMLLLILSVVFTSSAFGEELKVYAAAAVKTPLLELAAEYEAATGHKVTCVFDTAGATAQRFQGDSGAALLVTSQTLISEAEKTGKLFPQDTRKRYEVIQWLMFQMGGVGPMFGQANFFFRLSEKVPYAIDRYHKEALRLYKVLDQQLGKKEYLAGEYTIADIATYPWVWRHEMHQVKLEEFPNVKRWYDAISARPAVQRGMQIPKV